MRGNPRRVAVGALLIALGAAMEAEASSMVCGTTLVVPGATQAEVLRKCGEPTQRGLSSTGKSKSGRPKARRERSSKREFWVYDLGPNVLVRYLTFDRGRLVAIQFGGYGR